MNAPSKHSEKGYAPFDVVVVPFPYADRLAEKRRPAVVISAPALERDCGMVWLVMVTSAENRAWQGDVLVSDPAAVGLPAPSRIRPAKVAAVDADRIVRKIGVLPSKEARAVQAQIKKFLG
jgi:mRNA interferase MazF